MLAEDAKMSALGSMVAGVAHEVNTPLGVCVTAASLLDNSRRDIGRQLAEATLSQESLEAGLATIGEATAILEQNLQRAAKLIRSFKQIAVDQNTTESRTIKVGDFLDEILTAYHNPLKKAGVAARVDCPADLLMTTDAGAFAQIVTNLLQNTLLHARVPGQETQVRIAVRELGHNKIELVYADDGKGMDAEVAQRAFDPFFTTKRGQGGSGLGLNIVYNLVTQRFKGDVALDSAPGRGAVFTLHLTKD
jgi:signal transduction histidine kinase